MEKRARAWWLLRAGRVGSGQARRYTPRMSPSAEKLLKQVLTFDEKDRASVAGALIESLHGEVDLDAEEA